MFASRRHWSYSAINQYLRCPLQYYFERVLRLPKATVGGGLVLGSAVHAALARYHTCLKRQRPVAFPALQRVFLYHWNAQESNQSVQYKPGESRSALIELGLALVNVYLQSPPPENIVGVEQEFLIPLTNSRNEYLETPLAAVCDLVIRTPNGLKVRELKTSARAYSESEVAMSLQASCYANAVFESYGKLAAVEFAVLVKTKTPRLQRIPTARSQTDLMRLGDIVENVERSVDEGIFFPIETPLNCSGCPFREPCRGWKPARKLAAELDLVSVNGHAPC